MQGRIIVEASTLTTDTGGTGVLDTDGDVAVVDVSSLTNISIYLNQIVDNGNVTLTVEKSIDGTNFAPVAAKIQSDFAAGANKSIELSLSDSNGMALRAKQLKVTVSGKTGSGTYTATVVGSQVAGMR